MNMGRDIVDEILSRLPVKSLVRFRVVCKDWYVHIHSYCFIAKHMKNQTTNEKTLIYHQCIQESDNFVVSICSEQEIKEDDNYNSQTLFRQDQHYCIKDIPLDYLNYEDRNEDVQKLLKLYHSYGMQAIRVELVDTCNGLVCLKYCLCDSDSRIIALWNPATRDFKALQRFGTLRSDFGFGFDCISNDYKVLRVGYSFKKQRVKQVMIYSLNRNSWRKLDYSNVREITSRGKCKTISLCENVYWVNLSFDMLQNPLLLSFDMRKEVFQLTPLPLSIKFNFRLTEFFTLHDSIALVRHETIERRLEIWTRKELEQGRESWIKVFNIAQFPSIVWPPVFWKCINRDDFLFMFYQYIGEKRVMKGIYLNDRGEAKDDKDDKIVTIKVENNVMRPLKVLIYVETLVSVNNNKSWMCKGHMSL